MPALSRICSCPGEHRRPAGGPGWTRSRIIPRSPVAGAIGNTVERFDVAIDGDFAREIGELANGIKGMLAL